MLLNSCKKVNSSVVKSLIDQLNFIQTKFLTQLKITQPKCQQFYRNPRDQTAIFYFRCWIFKLMPPTAIGMMVSFANVNSFSVCRCASSSIRNFCSMIATPTFVNSLPIRMPMQLRGPSPNGKYGISLNVLPDLLAAEKRSGSNRFGLG